MDLIAEIDEASLGLPPVAGAVRARYAERLAARAVVFNAAGEVALLYAANRGYHKLPGGGIEAGETWQEAVCREAVEEIGCTIALRDVELGQIIEWRGAFNLRQVSFCGVADVVEDTGRTALTEEEIEVGLTLKWVTLDEALRLCAEDRPIEDEGLFIQARDLLFLKRACRHVSRML